MNKSFLIIKPDGMKNKGKILADLFKLGCDIQLFDVRLITRDEAVELYKEHKNKEFFEKLISHMTSGEVAIMYLTHPVFSKFDEIMHHLYRKKLRSKYGSKKDKTKNAVHISDSPANIKRELSIFFNI